METYMKIPSQCTLNLRITVVQLIIEKPQSLRAP